MGISVYLGIVSSRGHRGTIAVATLRPLMASSEDRRLWEQDFSDVTRRKEVFPNAGYVSWLYPDAEAEDGTLWQFEITDQPTYFDHPDDPWRDRFMVSTGTAKRAYPVLDVEDLGGEVQGRELLTTQGIQFPKGTACPCIIRVERTLWSVPPLRFVKNGELDNRWVLDLSNSTSIRCVRWEPPAEPIGCGDNSPRLFLPPDARPDGPAHLRDWTPDAALLVRVLRNLRKFDRQYADSLALTERAISRLGDVLAGPAPSAQDLEFEQGRVRRMKDFIGRLKTAHEIAKAAADALDNGPLAEEIARKKEDILDEERKTAKSKAEAEVADVRRQRDEVAERISEHKLKLASLEQEIEVKKADQRALVERLEVDLTRRVDEAMGKPEELLASVALIRAVMGSPDRGRETTSRAGPASSPAPGPRREGVACTSEAELLAALQKTLLRGDNPRAYARPLHSSFLAGAVPLLAGSRAYEVLFAYAQCVTGGTICWVPVSPTFLDPADLLGRADPSSGRFVPHPSGLLDLLLRARTDDRLHLVVLDGVNRAPVDSYLIPLLACRAGTQGGRDRSYPLLGVSGFDSTLSVPEDGRITWPPNVLLAGTLSLGSSGLPLARETWHHATLLLCDAVEPGPELEVFASTHPDARGAGGTSEPAWVVSLPTWTEWRTSCVSRDLTPCTQVLAKIAKDSPLPRYARDLALRFFSAAKGQGDDALAIGDTLAHCILPVLAGQPDELTALLDDAKTIYKDLARVIREAIQLTGA